MRLCLAIALFTINVPVIAESGILAEEAEIVDMAA